MPNLKLKLPSRNWLIFLSISGTFTSLVLYDKYEKKRAQKKWCTLVSHLAREPLDSRSMPRRLTVYLSAPPGDGLKASRDYFTEYVKPVLVAGALDWDVVEGRREGEVRAGLAEKIRKWRRKHGEGVQVTTPEEADVEAIVETVRQGVGGSEWVGMKGDLVIGRHTWKEYIRGLHEGWLGPVESPATPTPEIAAHNSPPESPVAADGEQASPATDDASPTASPTAPATEAEASEPPSKQAVTPALITPTAYASASPPQSLPQTFDPSTPLPLPHILGFLNTPTRLYRFLTRRHLAEQIGRETAAIVLAAQTRPYSTASTASTASEFIDPDTSSSATALTEQARTLEGEERDWIKSIRKRAAGDETERVWLDEVVLDPRVAARMSRFELASEDEARAARIGEGKEGARDEGGDGSGE
ncbi:MAG: mitochondrial import inner membrane translocase subunit tim54 [Thelocarpon impressellum]|nr:MAG: mitochondrial import inner membrane translocase subunit tim54 [Thelocarpon impressellum]